MLLKSEKYVNYEKLRIYKLPYLIRHNLLRSIDSHALIKKLPMSLMSSTFVPKACKNEFNFNQSSCPYFDEIIGIE